MTSYIGLTGYAGSGKDTVARLLAERFPVARIAFADALKHEVADAFSIDRTLLDEPALKSVRSDLLALRNCTDAGFCNYAWELGLIWPVSPRAIMQRWGDWRRSEDPDYFVKRAADIALVVTDGAPLCSVIFTDVRFPNEVALLRSLGGQLWRVVRNGQTAPTSHVSEHLLVDEPVDAEIRNDGSCEQLAKIATDLLLELRAREVSRAA